MKKYILYTSVAAAVLAGLAPAVASQYRTGLYGSPVADRAGGRVVDLERTQIVNVNCGDIVTFRSGSQTFTWRFDVMNHSVVRLGDIAPAGFPKQSVMVYVSGNDAELTSGA